MRPPAPSTAPTESVPHRNGGGAQHLAVAVLLTGLLVAPHLLAAPPVGNFEARYRVEEGDRLVGETRLILHWTGNRYHLRSESRPRGWLALLHRDEVIEESEGEWEAEGGRPLRYQYRHRRLGDDRRLTMRFDWQRRRLAITSEGETWHTSLQPAVQDKLSLRLAVMADLATGRLPESYPVADGGPIRRWRFTLEGRESLDTPLGTLRTLRLVRHRPDRQRISTIWHAVDLGYLPVRIDHRDADGRRARLVLESLEGITPGEEVEASGREGPADQAFGSVTPR